MNIVYILLYNQLEDTYGRMCEAEFEPRGRYQLFLYVKIKHYWYILIIIQNNTLQLIKISFSLESQTIQT